jgi:regulatory protein
MQELNLQEKDEQKKRAFNYALYLLGQSNLPIKKIQDKLKLKKYPPSLIEEVIQKLIGLNYLNDERYLQSKTRALVQQGKSNLYIRLFFKQQKIPLDNETLFNAREELGIFDSDNVKNYMEKHHQKLIDPKDRQKHIQRLLRRGYAWKDIKKALSERGETPEACMDFDDSL